MSLYFSVHLVLFALHSFAEPIKMLTAASVVSHRLDGPTARITPMNVSCIANKKKKNKKKIQKRIKIYGTAKQRASSFDFFGPSVDDDDDDVVIISCH